VARVVAGGRLRVAGDVTPRGLQEHPVGRRDEGDEPVTRTQTRCPWARGRGAEHEGVPLVVPGRAGCEAQLALVGVRACALAGPVKRR